MLIATTIIGILGIIALTLTAIQGMRLAEQARYRWLQERALRAQASRICTCAAYRQC